MEELFCVAILNRLSNFAVNWRSQFFQQMEMRLHNRAGMEQVRKSPVVMDIYS